MNKLQFEGVFALLLTPYLENKEIDWDIYDRYVDWQLSHHTQGLFAVCGSSEMGNLTQIERLELASRAVRRAGEVPVVATANVEPDTDEHPEELLRMAETGVSGVVLIPPNGMGVNQQKLGEYFAQMAEISPLPVFLYECPLVKPKAIDPGLYRELVNMHGIYGIKDTTCTMEGITAKIKGAPDSIVYQANTPLMLKSIHEGAGGIMATTTTACAKLVLKLWKLGKDRDPAADLVLEKLIKLDDQLRKCFTPTAKHLVTLQGIPMNVIARTGKVLDQQTALDIEEFYKSVLKEE